MSRIMKPDELPEDASFGVFDELYPTEPITIKLSAEAWEQLEKAFNEPPDPRVVERLKRLFENNE